MADYTERRLAEGFTESREVNKIPPEKEPNEFPPQGSAVLAAPYYICVTQYPKVILG